MDPAQPVDRYCCIAAVICLLWLQVLRLSEEQLSGGVLDDSCMSVIARGCTQLQELELVQVSYCCDTACLPAVQAVTCFREKGQLLILLLHASSEVLQQQHQPPPQK